MVKLIAETPLQGQVPVEIGTITLSEIDVSSAQSIAPFAKQATKVAAALKERFGIGLPKPNRVTGADPRLIWMGPGQYMLQGAMADDLNGAAVTDQSDAWVGLALSGEGVDDVLARLVPVDLRRTQFKTGHTARTLIGHMPCSVVRTSAKRLEVFVMRSMAGTLLHEVSTAARGVMARR